MRLNPTWQQDPLLGRIFRLLQLEGYQIFFVGGWVRDHLLGRPAADIDLATDATPDEVIRLFEREDINYQPVGIEFGSLLVGSRITVTTFRKDIKPYGRKVEVAFCKDLATDATRRDFTINAMYANFEGEIFDPLGGINDLWAKRVKFIGNPNHRIKEDYLRILRFFRFSSIYGDPDQGCDVEGLAAIKNLPGEVLGMLSGFRLKAEIFRLLSARPVYWCLVEWQETDTWKWLFPAGEAKNHQLLEKLEKQNQLAPNPFTSLVALGINIHNNRMEMTRYDHKMLAIISEMANNRDQSIETLAYRHGQEITRAIILIQAVLEEAEIPIDFEDRIASAIKQTFPLAAGDLMPQYKGRELGEVLRKLEKDWILSGFSLSKAELLELL